MAEKKSKAGSSRIVFPLLLLFGPAFLLVFFSLQKCENKFKVLDDYGNIPAFSFTDANGKKYTNDSFRNKIVIFTTIQPTCPNDCAIASWQLEQQLFKNIRQNPKKFAHVKIVSIITDGKGNPSDNFKDVMYTLENKVLEYNPKMWIVVTGDARALYNIQNNGKSLLQKGDKYYGGEAFQELMLLVDKRGHLRMVLNGKTESMMRTMKDHLALLQKQYDKEKARKEK